MLDFGLNEALGSYSSTVSILGGVCILSRSYYITNNGILLASTYSCMHTSRGKF